MVPHFGFLRKARTGATSPSGCYSLPMSTDDDEEEDEFEDLTPPELVDLTLAERVIEDLAAILSADGDEPVYAWLDLRTGELETATELYEFGGSGGKVLAFPGQQLRWRDAERARVRELVTGERTRYLRVPTRGERGVIPGLDSSWKDPALRMASVGDWLEEHGYRLVQAPPQEDE